MIRTVSMSVEPPRLWCSVTNVTRTRNVPAIANDVVEAWRRYG